MLISARWSQRAHGAQIWTHAELGSSRSSTPSPVPSVRRRTQLSMTACSCHSADAGEAKRDGKLFRLAHLQAGRQAGRRAGAPASENAGCSEMAALNQNGIWPRKWPRKWPPREIGGNPCR